MLNDWTKHQFILDLVLDSLNISPLTKPLINTDSWQYVPSMPACIDFVCKVMSLMRFFYLEQKTPTGVVKLADHDCI